MDDWKSEFYFQGNSETIIWKLDLTDIITNHKIDIIESQYR